METNTPEHVADSSIPIAYKNLFAITVLFDDAEWQICPVCKKKLGYFSGDVGIPDNLYCDHCGLVFYPDEPYACYGGY